MCRRGAAGSAATAGQNVRWRRVVGASDPWGPPRTPANPTYASLALWTAPRSRSSAHNMANSTVGIPVRPVAALIRG